MDVDGSPCESSCDGVCIHSPQREVPYPLNVLWVDAPVKLEIGDPVYTAQFSVIVKGAGPDQVLICHGHGLQLALRGPGA